MRSSFVFSLGYTFSQEYELFRPTKLLSIMMNISEKNRHNEKFWTNLLKYWKNNIHYFRNYQEVLFFDAFWKYISTYETHGPLSIRKQNESYPTN